MSIEKMNINPLDGYVNRGNLNRIGKVMDKSRNGEVVKLAFLGGSITQGCLATVHEKCYAYLTYEWWRNKYPNCKAEYINAGIGGTTSQYGVARVTDDVLSKDPDVVFVEFSVNDTCTEFFKETYESLIRRIYSWKSKPAIVLIHNIQYDNGFTAVDIHREVGKHYDLPSISMIPTIYASMERGEIVSLDVTEDNLHPNDAGHRIISEIIGAALNKMDEQVLSGTVEFKASDELPSPLTDSAYEASKCIYNNDDSVVLNGFIKDAAAKECYTDIFKNGWIGKNVGDKIEFTVEGTGIAVQYRKTINKPAPIARIVIDGDVDNAMILDGNFEETWGDELHLDTIVKHGEKKSYNVSVEIIETHDDDKSDFYLVSMIVS